MSRLKPYLNLANIITFIFIACYVMVGMVLAQGVAADPNILVAPTADTPVVVVEGANAVEQWIDSLFKVVLGGVGLVLAFAIRTTVSTLASTLPGTLGGMITMWIDSTRQKDMHSAIMSQLSTIIQEGRWSGNAADFILELKRNIIDSTPQAAKHFEVSPAPDPKQDDVIINLANRMSVDVQAKIARTLSDATLAAQAAVSIGDPRTQELAEGIVKVFTKGSTLTRP